MVGVLIAVVGVFLIRRLSLEASVRKELAAYVHNWSGLALSL
jgi:hypothetical protein